MEGDAEKVEINESIDEDETQIVKYKISSDGKGLRAYWNDEHFYHIHSDEMSKLEKWIHSLLKKVK